jgi:hypothetical protein
VGSDFQIKFSLSLREQPTFSQAGVAGVAAADFVRAICIARSSCVLGRFRPRGASMRIRFW